MTDKQTDHEDFGTVLDTPDAADAEATDPYRRASQTFPRLSAEHLHRIHKYGEVEVVEAGACLFSRGDRSTDFFVVLEGSIEVVGSTSPDTEAVIGTQEPGQFTGEIDLFNNRAILTSARAGAKTRLLRICRSEFRRLIAAEPDIGEIIGRAFILRRMGLVRHAQGGVTLVGIAQAAETVLIEEFLTRNDYPHATIDPSTDDGGLRLLEHHGSQQSDMPLVLLPGGQVLSKPAIGELADAIGMTEAFDPDHVYDLAVVGAGPAGLAAAVYAASEGLDTLIIERFAPGGQAGTSSRIENYLGFPTGVSGQELSGRGQVQAQRFGARLAISRAVEKVEPFERNFRVTLKGGEQTRARVIVAATGARYRRLNAPGVEGFKGGGIYYAATGVEAELCIGREVVVVGGANSAGQAALFLSRTTKSVHLIVRESDIGATMSYYLVTRIHSSPKIQVHLQSEVTAVEGTAALESVSWKSRDGEKQKARIAAMFVMIGAEPNTDWLTSCVTLDDKGYVETKMDTGESWSRSPYASSRPGIFAVGDLRSNSVKRVASSVGEGSVVIAGVHEYLDRDE